MCKRCLTKETKYLEVEMLSLSCIILKGIAMEKRNDELCMLSKFP